MKILFVFNHPAPYKVDFFNELAKEVDLTVFFERKKEKDRVKDFYKTNYKFHAIFSTGLSFGNGNSYTKEVIKTIQNGNFDLIIMNGYHTLTEMKTIDFLRKYRVPYVLYINGGIIKNKEPSLKKKLKQKYISNADLYFSPDTNSNKYLIYYGAAKEKIINYPYSTIYKKEVLNAPLTILDKQALKTELNIPYDKIVISCGQFIKRKNYELLIEQWKDVSPNIHLIIIGGGKLKKSYLQLIKKYKLNNVHIFDFMKQDLLFKYFQVSDLFIFPSKEDIYGHVINEAMSQGLPILSSKFVNASLNLIKEDTNGYFYDYNNKDELINKINLILNKEKQMSEKAIETAKNYTIEKMTQFHVAQFQEWTNKK